MVEGFEFDMTIMVGDEPHVLRATLRYTRHKGAPAIRERGGAPISPPEPPSIEPVALLVSETEVPLGFLSSQQIADLEARILEDDEAPAMDDDDKEQFRGEL